MIDFECDDCGAVSIYAVSEVRMGWTLYCFECDSTELTELP